MSRDALRITIESTPKKAFACAIDWPGWCRSGKTPDAALETLLAYAPRYAAVAREAGVEPPAAERVEVVERLEGGSGTEFGVPSSHAADDGRPTNAAQARHLAGVVDAAWRVFDRVAAAAPEELRKGPRGGGRDRTRVVAHIVGADDAYARELGLRRPATDPGDAAAVRAQREAILEVLRAPSDGGPVAKRWAARYAYRRIAWHALDHAWEIEDRTEP